jgi:hypothetical protein
LGVDKDIALSFLDLGTRRGGWSAPRPGLTPGKDRGTHRTGGWWAPGPVWTCAKILAPTGIRSPDRPARSQLLYQLSYPAESNIHEYQEYFLGGKDGRFIDDNLIAFLCCCLKIWEPKLPGTLRACRGLYRDCFNFIFTPSVTVATYSLE